MDEMMTTHDEAAGTPENGAGFVRQCLSGRHFLWTVFLIAFLLRIALMLLLPQHPLSDGGYYFDEAIEIANGQGYQENGYPTAFWPVGYPAVLAGSMLLFGNSLLGPMIVNLIATGFTLWGLLWFGRQVAGGELAARIAVLVYALYPAQIGHAGTTFSETSSTAIALVAFAILIGRRTSAIGLAISGLLFGACTLMRAQTMLFPFGAIIALAVVYPGFGWRGSVKAMLIVYLSMAAVILPWGMRNERMLGHFVPVSTNGGIGLYIGANPQATGEALGWTETGSANATGIPFDQRIVRQVELDQRFRSLAIDWIKKNPGKYASLGVRKLFLLWMSDSDGFWALEFTYPHLEYLFEYARWINQIYYMMISIFALPCLFSASSAVLRGREKNKPLGLLLCMPIFVSLIGFIFSGQTRYHHPAIPFLIVAAGWTVAMMMDGRWPLRKRSPAAASAA